MPFLLILWPIAEVLVAIEVARAIGVLLMLLAVIASWPIGSWALRSQGAAAWRRLREAVLASRHAGREVLDGALILIGGILLIVPGFITDGLGVLLLLPFTRSPLRRLLARNLQSRVVVSATQFGRMPYDVDSTATDIDQPRLRP
jgi:UPF0716 protein FxsA